MRIINHWIGGQTVDTEPDRTGAVYDPASGQQTAQVAYATGEDVDAAVRAAQAAYPAWRDTSTVKRARVMFRFLELLQRNRDELARIIASEHGKVVPDAAGEIQRDLSVSTRVAELYAEAGLPDGIFNVVHGDKVAVDAILDHPGIAAVSFVGS